MNRGISRRDFLRRSAGLGAALLMSRLPFSTTKAQMGSGGEFMPDAVINIRSVVKTVQILPGSPTTAWGYEGELVSGTGVTVDSIRGSYLGPIIRAQTGTKVRINYTNLLNEVSVIHPHGLNVPENCDGQPMQAIGTGETKVYDFQVVDRAGPYWFHPHPMMRTAAQVAMGMAGIFYVTDPVEQAVVPGASIGTNDIPIVLQDRLFDSSNQFLYAPNQMWGYLGDRILVNGQLNTVLNLEPRGYRMRFLNGSNSRTFKLAWSNGMPLKVIGTDGGLLPAPVSKSYVMLMPGERVDVWVDFSSQAGKQLILRSLSFSPTGGMMGGGGMGGMGGGGMMGSALANGAAFNILNVNVGRKAATRPVLGTAFPPLPDVLNASTVMNFNNPVPFTLDMAMMNWYINGRTYEEMVTADDEMVYKDVPIAWEWINNSPIPHPMHLHNVQFKVIGRTSPGTSSYATINQGLVDTGLKDTVLVWPGERVKIAMVFKNYTGMYMYHCHILEHEDMGMMRNLMVMDSMMAG